MFQRLYDYLYLKLADKNFNSDDELGLYMILSVACAFTGAIHIVLLVFYLIIGISQLAMINICSISCYILLLLLLRRSHFTAAGLLFSFEVILYSFVSFFLTGTDNYTILYLFVILLAQLLIPYSTLTIRSVMIAVIWISVLLSLPLSLHAAPIHLLTQFQKNILILFNFHVGIIAIIIEVTIDLFSKRIISRFNKKRMHELQDQAYTDALTGLYNRHYADEFFHFQADAPKQSWCVAMLDIDDFKKINDRYGHSIGDVVLKTLAEIIRNNLRKTDLIFRWGGEEFLLMLENIDLMTAYGILDKLRKNISETPIDTSAARLHITATIGVAPFDPQDAEACIDQADKKLYQGKQSTKNVCVM